MLCFNQISLLKLAAKDADDYVQLATELANDQERLVELRSSLHDRMQVSPLVGVTEFTR